MSMRLSIAVLCMAGLATAALAGDLDPSGPPAPTMKTLNEVEARTPISSVPFTITEPGSYYLTQNLELATLDTDGIVIEVDNVTLDLNGFSLIGPGKSAGTYGNGIVLAMTGPPGYATNLAIRNGGVRDWRRHGIQVSDASNSQFTDLRCASNGAVGLITGNGCTLTNVAAIDNGEDGISAGGNTGAGACTIIDCIATENANVGILAGPGSTCTDCLASDNHTGIAAPGATVVHCTANDNTSHGIDGDSEAATITGCSCRRNGGHGIRLSMGCRAEGNMCLGNGYPSAGAGIYALSDFNHIKDNYCVGNGWGLQIAGAGNVVSNNVLRENTVHVDIAAGNQLDMLIGDLPYTIALPGMYRVTGDLKLDVEDTDGILIQVDDITLDLGGHTLAGPGKDAGTLGIGIRVNMMVAPGYATSIAIRNGGVREWRSGGILADQARSSQFENLRCTNNGQFGISTGGGCTLTNITAYENAGPGIYAGFGGDGKCTITGCTANNNQGNGICAGFGPAVIGCVASSNTVDGIVAGGGTVANCVCNQNGNNGISGVDYGATINGCSCRENADDGIELFMACRAEGNTCVGNGYPSAAAGIHAISTHNAILRNHCIGNGRGLDIDNATNYSSQNTLSGNTTNEDLGGSTEGAGDLANIEF